MIVVNLSIDCWWDFNISNDFHSSRKWASYFLLNNIVADINQPQINLNIVTDEIKNNISSIHSSNNTKSTISNTIAKFDTIAINNGKASATNLILRLYYPNGMIINFSSDIQSENVILDLLHN
jgi:hypothetical protein